MSSLQNLLISIPEENNLNHTIIKAFVCYPQNNHLKISFSITTATNSSSGRTAPSSKLYCACAIYLIIYIYIYVCISVIYIYIFEGMDG